jgi:1-acyl-sn-glycerol-3-phosphate acyltransferase
MKKKLKKLWRWFFWKINSGIVPLIVWAKYGKFLKFEGDKLPKAPYIMLSNHANLLDPWIVCHASKTPVSIMMNEDGFKAPFFRRWFLKNIGAFPKKKGLSDIGSMKRSISEIKANYPLMIFPEGQTSWDGETQPIYPGIEKMAQKLNVSIVMHRIEGNFLAHPWWAEDDRKGQIIVHRKIIDAETVKSKNFEEIRGEIINYIKHNDVEKSKNNKFSGKNLVSGMENLLWICPSCKELEKLKFEKNSIICEKCKKEQTFNANLYLENPENEITNLYEWVKMQKNFARNLIENAKPDEILCESEKARLVQSDYGGLIATLDIGKLRIYKEKLLFLGDSAKIEIAVKNIVAPVFQRKNIVQFEHEKNELKFMFLYNSMMKPLCFLRELTGWQESEKRGYFI